MKLRTNTIPNGWNGEVLGIYKKDEEDAGTPRDLKSFLSEALVSAHTSGHMPTGQPKPESADVLLNRWRIRSKLDAEEVVTLTNEEFTLIQTCVASHFLEVASVPIIGTIHASIEPEKEEEKEEET